MSTLTRDERESDTLAPVHASSTEGAEDASIEPVPDTEREPYVAPVPDTDKKLESVSPKVPSQNDEQEASRHLWVGNVSSNVTEAVVIERFSKFGEVENAMVYPMRNYAFVNFKKLEDAVYAKKGLQGANLEGLAIRIEFAKGVKTCRYLWVGNICGTVTRDELEAEFKKFGVVEDLRLVRDRNCAFVDYTKVDDAIAAYESLNRKKLGKKEICIEYVRSQLQSRKDNKVEDRHETYALGDEQSKMTSSNGGRTNSEKFKRDKDGNTSEVLWIGFPIYMKVDERKLRRTFSPFGVIERVTTFPGRTYAFVQFQNVKSASRAKDALQGKLFNDPRVSISFAKSEVGPADHNRAINSPADHSRAINNFTSSISRSDLPPLLPLQKAGASVNPRNDRYLGLSTSKSGGPNFRRSGDESDAYHRYEREPNLNMKNNAGRIMRAGPEHGMKPDIGLWRSRPLPESGIPHFQHSPPYGEGRWNAQEELGKREQKRQRTGDHNQGGTGVVELSSFEVGNDREQLQVVRAQDYLSKVTKTSGSDSRVPENWQEYEGVPQGRLPSSNADFPVPVKDDWSHPAVAMRPPDGGFQWQGVLAKSGTSVCHAKCYAVSNHIDAIFPEVINCTARTSLDMLAQHISQVGNFAVVSFIPLGDFDVAPYQEFILYLSEKNRAAVCKLSVESTLFLVPPSRFAEQILKVPNNNTIFGVVLKSQHTDPSSQFFTEQMGVSQPIQMQRLLPPNGLAELTPNAPLGQSLPDTAPSHAPYIMPSAAEMIHSQTSQPQQLGFQTSSSSIPVFTPGIMVSSAAQLNTVPGHISIVDGNSVSQQAPGFPPPSHDHLSTSLISASYNIVPTQSHQEQGLQTPFQAMVPPNQVTSGSEQFPVLRGPINQNMPVSVPFQQPPLPPQYPPPIMQPSHSDHVLVAPHQPQTSSNNVQLPQTNLPPQLPPSGQLQVHHQTAPPNLGVGQIADSWSVGIQPPPPAVTKVEGGQLPQQIAGQPEIQASQQNLPGKGGGDDTKRFQATLQLAAALLQQLQQRTQS